MRLLVAISAALLAFAAACGEGSEEGAPAGHTSPDQTSAIPTTPPSSTPRVTTTTASPLPGGDLMRCESPAGFAISAPASWHSNEGDVVPRCGQFNPDPFEVPRGTDERVAAIVVYRERVDYATAARPKEDRDEDRFITTVDGRQAVRLSFTTTGEGLYPSGIPVTRYFVDVWPTGGDPATLVADTLGTEPFDHERNTVVLDRMVQTLDITDPRVVTDASVIATYLGGGGGYSVRAEQRSGSICLRIPPKVEPVCAAPPAEDQVNTIPLRDLNRDVPAGLTGADVWRVEIVARSGETHSYLPAPVPGTRAGAYAFPDTVGEVDRLGLYDVRGNELRTVGSGST
jgi:hypothetical protein